MCEVLINLYQRELVRWWWATIAPPLATIEKQNMKGKFLIILLVSFWSCDSANKTFDISKISHRIENNGNEAKKYNESVENLYGVTKSDNTYQIYTKKADDFIVEFRAPDINDKNWFNGKSITIKISKHNNLLFEKEITCYEAIGFSNETKQSQVNIQNNRAYISYIGGKQDEENSSQSINLIIVDLSTKSIIFNKPILNQSYGITNITSILNINKDKLLIAYNDISKPNNKSLYYSVFNLSTLNFDKKPEPAFIFDKWEKTEPTFIKDNETIYFCNTTGGEYGLLAHNGKPEFAISKINEENELVNYTVITDSGRIYNENIINGILFYRLAVGDQSEEIIKKIGLYIINKQL